MRAVLAGEAMLELSQVRDGWRLGYGGDTLNTAIHMARSGLETAYFTAIGNDPLSSGLKAKWGAEGLDTSLVLTHPGRTTGLYAITTDDSGERDFTYWRETSAARELFSLDVSGAAKAAIEGTQLFGFSLISLAILPERGRKHLLDLASAVRANGGLVAFDGNYRSRLWPDPGEARTWRDAAIAVADIGLPTLEDEVAQSSAIDAGAVIRHWQSLGCNETVVKLGVKGCLLPDGSMISPPTVLKPLDTSGAGDAFNGGYLAARMRGRDLCDAAMSGHAVAGWTVMRGGAVPPADEEAPYP